MEPIDLELWRAAVDGNHRAFPALVDRHARSLFRLATSLSASRSDAEDICQETFAAAFRGLKSFGGRASFKTWLTRILMRRAAKIWNKEKNSRRTISLHQENREGDIPHANPGGSLASQLNVAATTTGVDQRLDIMEVIRTLSPEFRDAIVLREIEGLSYQEIADALDVPRGTIESRLHRARAELRRRLTGY